MRFCMLLSGLDLWQVSCLTIISAPKPPKLQCLGVWPDPAILSSTPRDVGEGSKKQIRIKKIQKTWENTRKLAQNKGKMHGSKKTKIRKGKKRKKERTHHRLFGFILSLLISIATCAYVLLSWYALRGKRCDLPPAPPHPPLFFNRFPLLPTILFFISIIVYLGSCYLYGYPSPLVPMCFFLGTHCGGRRAPPPAFIF